MRWEKEVDFLVQRLNQVAGAAVCMRWCQTSPLHFARARPTVLGKHTRNKKKRATGDASTVGRTRSFRVTRAAKQLKNGQGVRATAGF